MAATLKIDTELPAFTGQWTGGDAVFISHASMSAPVNRKIEPLGPHFLAHARRVRLPPPLSPPSPLTPATEAPLPYLL